MLFTLPDDIVRKIYDEYDKVQDCLCDKCIDCI